MKKYIFWIVVIAAFCYGEYVYYCLPIDFSNRQIFNVIQPSRTGTVTSDFTELDNVKHGTQTEYYLEIQYNTGREIHNVSAKIFYKYRPGDKVILHETKTIPGWLFPIPIINAILCIAIPLAALVLIIVWVFDIKYLSIRK